MIPHTKKRTFPLLEIVLITAVVLLAFGGGIFLLNPRKQIIETQDIQREIDVNTILNAIYQYAIDTGEIPSEIPNSLMEICLTSSSDCTEMIDLSRLTHEEKYLDEIPRDPVGGVHNGGSGYAVYKTNKGVRVISLQNRLIEASR